jgi:hypothetical protein
MQGHLTITIAGMGHTGFVDLTFSATSVTVLRLWAKNAVILHATAASSAGCKQLNACKILLSTEPSETVVTCVFCVIPSCGA